MKKTFKIAALIILLTGAALALNHFLTMPREEGIATLKPVELKIYSDLTAYASPGVYAAQEKPADLIDLPAGTTAEDRLLFFSLPLGKNTVLAACREDQPEDYTVWLDTDLDRQLSDEKPLAGTAKEHPNNPASPWKYLDYGLLQISTDAFTSSPFRLTLALGGFYMEIHPTQCVEGKIRLGKNVCRVAAVDGDFDGQYKTLYEPSVNRHYHQCDTFVADIARGLFPSYDVSRLFPLGRYCRVYNEGYYSVDLSADGTKLKMQKVQPETGRLKVAAPMEMSAEFLSDAVSLSAPLSGETELPAGRYQFHYAWLSCVDENGKQHSLMADFSEAACKGLFEIQPGQTCTLYPGPPFTIRTDILRHRDTLAITTGLVGNEGETYGLRIVREMPEPTLRILDQNGVELHTGTMEYG